MIFSHADKENKRLYTVFFNIFKSQANLKTASSHFKRVILNKYCSRIRSFSLKKSTIKWKKDSSNNHRISPGGDETLTVISKAIRLVKMLSPKNTNILVFGD